MVQIKALLATPVMAAFQHPHCLCVGLLSPCFRAYIILILSISIFCLPLALTTPIGVVRVDAGNHKGPWGPAGIPGWMGMQGLTIIIMHDNVCIDASVRGGCSLGCLNM